MTFTSIRGLRIFSVLLMTLAFVFVMQSSSFAIGGSTGNDSTDDSNSWNDPPKGSGPTGPSGDPPVKPPGHLKTTTTTIFGAGGTAACVGAAVSSGRELIGVSTTKVTRVWQDYGGGPWYGEVISETLTCLLSPTYEERAVTCVVSSNAMVARVYPATNVVQSVNKNSAYAGSPTLNNCLTSKQWIEVDATPNMYGHWSANGSTTIDRCTLRHYTSVDLRTGAVPADELRGCSRVYNTNPFSARGTLTCLGWTDGVHLNPGAYSFTEDDCLNNGTPNSLQCLVGGAPLIDWDGQSYRGTSVQTLRNGSNVRMRWDTPTLAGSGFQNVISARSRLAVTNPPWSNQFSLTNNWFGLQKTGSSVNALENTSGTPWLHNQLHTDWTAQWYQPTDVPTTFTPQYYFTANFLKQSVRITGINPDGGWRTEAVNVTVQTNASCSAPTLNVTTLRVVNGVS